MELELIHQKIYTLRNCKVTLDYDLALLYEVECNYSRPTSDAVTNCDRIFKKTEYQPYAFMKQGLAMLSGIFLINDKQKEIDFDNQKKTGFKIKKS